MGWYFMGFLFFSPGSGPGFHGLGHSPIAATTFTDYIPVHNLLKIGTIYLIAFDI
jgi:hypothetical protein